MYFLQLKLQGRYVPKPSIKARLGQLYGGDTTDPTICSSHFSLTVVHAVGKFGCVPVSLCSRCPPGNSLSD